MDDRWADAQKKSIVVSGQKTTNALRNRDTTRCYIEIALVSELSNEQRLDLPKRD